MHIDIDINFRGETHALDSLFIWEEADWVEPIFQNNSSDH